MRAGGAVRGQGLLLHQLARGSWLHLQLGVAGGSGAVKRPSAAAASVRVLVGYLQRGHLAVVVQGSGQAAVGLHIPLVDVLRPVVAGEMVMQAVAGGRKLLLMQLLGMGLLLLRLGHIGLGKLQISQLLLPHRQDGFQDLRAGPVGWSSWSAAESQVASKFCNQLAARTCLYRWK